MIVKSFKVVGYVYNIYLQGKDHLLVKIDQPQPNLTLICKNYVSKVDLGPSYFY